MHISEKQYWMIVLLLSCAASILTAIQSTRITPLIDYSYQVENAYRIFLGEMPYRDFFLVLPPGTYIIMAAFMKLTGGYVHSTQIFYVMFTAFVGILIVSKILKTMNVPPHLSILLLFPIIFVGSSLFPFPSYDLNTTFFILVALSVLLHVQQKFPGKFIPYFLTGIIISLPAYFKQTMGLIFVFSILAVWIILTIRIRKRLHIIECAALMMGVGTSFSIFFFILSFTGSWNQFIFQNFAYSAQIRKPIKELFATLGQYINFGTLLITDLPIVFIEAILFCVACIWRRFSLLLSLIFSAVIGIAWGRYLFFQPLSQMYYNSILGIWSITYFLTGVTMLIGFIKARTPQQVFFSLLPIPLAAAAHGAYLSGNLVDNCYGAWPFLVILAGGVIVVWKKLLPQFHIFYPICLISCFLSILLFMFLQSNRFYRYLQLDGPVAYATMPNLRGMGARGPWIPNMENMVAYTQRTFPRDARIAFLPGEDPFFAVTGRRNRLPFNQLNFYSFTLTSDDLPTMLMKQNIEWVILKTLWQVIPSSSGMYDLAETEQKLSEFYQKVTILPGYVIYQRIR